MQGQQKLDEALYDRQLRVLSREAMAKITKTEVLVVGLTGLGVEFGMYLLFCGATHHSYLSQQRTQSLLE